jgi:hypothetical protein
MTVYNGTRGDCKNLIDAQQTLARQDIESSKPSAKITLPMMRTLVLSAFVPAKYHSGRSGPSSKHAKHMSAPRKPKRVNQTARSKAPRPKRTMPLNLLARAQLLSQPLLIHHTHCQIRSGVEKE